MKHHRLTGVAERRAHQIVCGCDLAGSAKTSDVAAFVDEVRNSHYRRPVTPRRTREPAPYLIPLAFDGTEVLSVDASPDTQGWAAYFSPPLTELDAQVLLRVAPQPNTAARPDDEAAWEIREVRAVVGEPTRGFPSSLLREVPILRVEAAINQTMHRRRLAERLGSDFVYIGQMPGGTRYRQPPPVMPAVDRRPLTIQDPGGYRKPDAFYHHVADLYLHLAAATARPAHRLAEANRVPVATVHRWVREAKARGVLVLPAHRGENTIRAAGRSR